MSYFSSVAALVVAATFSLFIGVADINLDMLLHADKQTIEIMLISRVPRLLSICLAGAALSIAGQIMQQIVQNKFAAPSTTGTLDSALLGYMISIIWFSDLENWQQLFVIMLFSIIGTLFFVHFIQAIKLKNKILVPLIGIMYGSVISSLTTFISYKYDLIQTMNSWRIANFASVLGGNYELLYLAIPLTIIAYFFSSQFNAVSLGKFFAQNIGINYQKIIYIGIMIVSILASTVVMIVGVIPFIGLIIPNIVSLFLGDNLKRTLPWTAYWGVMLVLICDILGRLIIFPFEIPIAMIISLIGGAAFIVLILRDKTNA